MRTLQAPERESVAVAERDPLKQALQTLSRLIGSVMPSQRPTPISAFKARYGLVLKRADLDGVALISQGQKRYVIVSEDHMLTLSQGDRSARTVADVCRALPRPRSAVDLSAAQMSGAQGDIDVPARRAR